MGARGLTCVSVVGVHGSTCTSIAGACGPTRSSARNFTHTSGCSRPHSCEQQMPLPQNHPLFHPPPSLQAQKELCSRDIFIMNFKVMIESRYWRRFQSFGTSVQPACHLQRQIRSP